MTERYTLAQLVSIHTRHYWRVKLFKDVQRVLASMFQSTPAITGG